MMKSLLEDFAELFYPNLCLVCGEILSTGEKYICLACMNEIPRTGYHLLKDNPVEKRFWLKFPVEQGTSFFFFHKGSMFQKLLHELKYNGKKAIGKMLASRAAADFCENNFFGSVDMIVPVPLHPEKMKKRGYNQAEWIGKGLEAVMQKPQDSSSLIRVKENDTQTKKGVFERYTNTEGIFELANRNAVAGRHILLVDDVLTTGSTIEAAAMALLRADNVKISVFTLAVSMQ